MNATPTVAAPPQFAPQETPIDRPSRGWAWAGLVAGIAGLGTMVGSSMVDAVYDPDLDGDTAKIADKLADQVPQMIAFHTFGMIAAVALIVFAAGSYRRLAGTVSAHSLTPFVAFSGLFGTAVVLVLGTGLTTEFVFANGKEEMASAESSAFFAHWIGTIPWCWGLVGLSGIALFAAARQGAVPTWLGRVGLIGGGVTLLFGISPLQYMAGMFAPLGLIVISLGFLFGDKAYRAGREATEQA